MTARALGHTYTPNPAPAGARPAGSTVTLTVEHLDTDSYSRSVDRAALKWARDVGTRTYPGAWTLTDGRYAVRSGRVGSNGRPVCLSDIVFRVTR